MNAVSRIKQAEGSRSGRGLSFARKRSWRPRDRALAALCFAASMALSGAGLLIAQVPLFVAYLPFALALFTQTKRIKIACLAGHFIWVAIISVWGLSALGTHEVLTFPAAFGAVLALSWSMTLVPIGVSSLLLCLLPWFPANPLIIAGALFPGWGIAGLAVLAGLTTAIEVWPRPQVRAGLIVVLLIFSASAHLFAALDESGAGAGPDEPADFTSVDLPEPYFLTRSQEWAAITQTIGIGATAILGENIFKYDDVGATNFWCRIASQKDTQLFIGVEGKEGVSEVWQFNPRDCAPAARIYRAQFGIPGITGAMLPGRVAWDSWLFPGSGPQWVACYEGFSPMRWISIGRAGAQTAIVIANDAMTAPLPTDLVRTKVASTLARLFNVTPVFAAKGQTILIGPKRSLER